MPGSVASQVLELAGSKLAPRIAALAGPHGWSRIHGLVDADVSLHALNAPPGDKRVLLAFVPLFEEEL